MLLTIALIVVVFVTKRFVGFALLLLFMHLVRRIYEDRPEIHVQGLKAAAL